MNEKWTNDKILTLARGFQPTCVLFAAADLDVFTLINQKPRTSNELADLIEADLRAITILLDALTAMTLLTKQNDQYTVPAEVAKLLSENGSKNILPMVRHQANCMRRWIQLSLITKTGKPARRSPSIRGEKADLDAFIGAMDNVSNPVAADVIDHLGSLDFRFLLDVGGASGTWTIALLCAFPQANAVIFDLPEVIPLAKKRIADAGLTDKVVFVPGDFYKDKLPKGADLVWLSAIAHQNSQLQNKRLFKKIYNALDNKGLLIIRDVLMDNTHTSPQAGAMFAVNMLTATKGGGTYSFEQYQADLSAVGFKKVTLIRRDENMNSLIRAEKIK